MSVVQFHPTIKNDAYETYCNTLSYLNMAFTTMFFIESILKILAFGLKVCRSVVLGAPKFAANLDGLRENRKTPQDAARRRRPSQNAARRRTTRLKNGITA